MAYILSGSEGSFAYQSGDTFYSGFFTKATVMAWTLSINSESHDITPLGGAGANGPAAKTLTGLRSYSATITGYIMAGATPQVVIGNEGGVAIASPAYYAANARAWTLNLEPYAVHDVTSLSGSPSWRSFRPDNLLRWSGSYVAGVDTDTIIRTGGSGTEPIQTFSITDDTSGTDLHDMTLTYGNSVADETFIGEVQITSAGVPVQRGNKTEATFNFVGSSELAAAGTNILFTGNGIASGKVKAPVWSGNGSAALVARFYAKTAATARYFETADMFWRRITINCEVGQPVTYSMELVGSGALTSN